LPRDSKRLFDRQSAARDAFGKRFAVDELERERADPVRLFDTVDGCNMWMCQRCERACLAFKSRAAASVADERLR